MKKKMVSYNSRDTSYILVGQQEEEYSHGIVDTSRSLRAEIKIFKEDNDKLVEVEERITRAQEKFVEVKIGRASCRERVSSPV